MGYQFSFTVWGEIRMGSPYNSADVDLQGGFAPAWVPRRSVQDLAALSADGNTCLLVEWQIDEKGDPGFRLWKLEDRERRVSVSARIVGCCQSLSLTADGSVELECFHYPNYVKHHVTAFEEKKS